MSQKIKKIIFQATPVIIISTLLIVIIVYAWTEPTKNPPQGNVPTPVNVGTSTQYKLGALGVGGVFEAFSSIVAESPTDTILTLRRSGVISSYF